MLGNTWKHLCRIVDNLIKFATPEPTEGYKPPFYFKWWFLLVCIALFWPISFVLLFFPTYIKHHNKWVTIDPPAKYGAIISIALVIGIEYLGVRFEEMSTSQIDNTTTLICKAPEVNLVMKRLFPNMQNLKKIKQISKSSGKIKCRAIMKMKDGDIKSVKYNVSIISGSKFFLFATKN